MKEKKDWNESKVVEERIMTLFEWSFDNTDVGYNKAKDKKCKKWLLKKMCKMMSKIITGEAGDSKKRRKVESIFRIWNKCYSVGDKDKDLKILKKRMEKLIKEEILKDMGTRYDEKRDKKNKIYEVVEKMRREIKIYKDYDMKEIEESLRSFIKEQIKESIEKIEGSNVVLEREKYIERLRICLYLEDKMGCKNEVIYNNEYRSAED